MTNILACLLFLQASSIALMFWFTQYHILIVHGNVPAWKETKIIPMDGSAYSYFGYAVAYQAETMVVGAIGDENQGSVYVYIRENKTWTLKSKLTASDGTEGDLFGVSVDVDADKTIVVGSLKNDGLDPGAVYVFHHYKGSWNEQAKLVAGHGDDDSSASFGVKVAIHGDTIVIGSPGSDSTIHFGCAYVFVRSNDTWLQQTKLQPTNPSDNNAFGRSLAIDSEFIVVGAPETNFEKGAVYVYTRSGIAWSEIAIILTPSDGKAGDHFGRSIAIDRETIVVGLLPNVDNLEDSAFVYVYTKPGETWLEETKLCGGDNTRWAFFGYSVAVQSDLLVVGAPDDENDGVESGSVYIFSRCNNTWSLPTKLIACDGSQGDSFGREVAVHGSTIVVGADSSNDDSGAAYVYMKQSLVTSGVPCMHKVGDALRADKFM